MRNSLLAVFLISASLSVHPAIAQSDLDIHHLSHRGTKVAVKLAPNVQRKTGNTKMNEGSIPHTFWQSSTVCCSHIVMAMDMESMFSKGMLPDQIPYDQAQEIFDGSVRKLLSKGGTKAEDKKERWGKYPSRKVQVFYKNPRAVTVIRSIMVGTVSWIFLWEIKEGETNHEWKRGYKSFYGSIEVIEDK